MIYIYSKRTYKLASTGIIMMMMMMRRKSIRMLACIRMRGQGQEKFNKTTIIITTTKRTTAKINRKTLTLTTQRQQ